MDIVRECPLPTLCWIFADSEGHIGRQANGWFPDRVPTATAACCRFRPGTAKSLARPAAQSTCCRASTIRPKVLWPRPTKTSYVPGGPRWSRCRCPTIAGAASTSGWPRWTMPRSRTCKRLQYDVVSLQARELLPIFLPELPDGEIKERLAAWDLQLRPRQRRSHAVLAIVSQRAVGNLRPGAAQAASVGGMLYLCSHVGFSTMPAHRIDRLLVQDQSLWWQGRDKGQLIRKAAASLAGEQEQPWSATNGFHFTNRFFESPLVGRALGLSHSRNGPCPAATPRCFKDTCCAARARDDVRPVVSFRHRQAPAKPGPICPAAPAKAGSRAGTRTTFRAGCRASTRSCRSKDRLRLVNSLSGGASRPAEVSPGRVSPLFHRAGRLRSRPDGRLPSASDPEASARRMISGKLRAGGKATTR